jgi:regulator of RNase E activity RraA
LKRYAPPGFAQPRPVATNVGGAGAQVLYDAKIGDRHQIARQNTNLLAALTAQFAACHRFLFWLKTFHPYSGTVCFRVAANRVLAALPNACVHATPKEARMNPDNAAAIRVFLNAKRPQRALVAQFEGVPTGNICDAMARFGALDYRIRPVAATMRMCGPALTVRTRPGDNLVIYQALEVARPGDVLVISTYEHTSGSTIGDLVVNIARKRGITGIVCDGLVRDVRGIREIGLPVFARGTSPSPPLKEGPGEVNGPVSCAGVTVSAGDLVVGDEDGVVVVPFRELETTAERLKAVAQKEARMLSDIESGILTVEAICAKLKHRGVEFVE